MVDARLMAALALALLACLVVPLHLAFRRGRPGARFLAFVTDPRHVLNEPLGYVLLPVASFLSIVALALVLAVSGVDLGTGPGLYLLAGALLATSVWAYLVGRGTTPDRWKPEWLRTHEAEGGTVDVLVLARGPTKPSLRAIALFVVLGVGFLWITFFFHYSSESGFRSFGLPGRVLTGVTAAASLWFAVSETRRYRRHRAGVPQQAAKRFPWSGSGQRRADPQ